MRNVKCKNKIKSFISSVCRHVETNPLSNVRHPRIQKKNDIYLFCLFKCKQISLICNFSGNLFDYYNIDQKMANRRLLSIYSNLLL